MLRSMAGPGVALSRPVLPQQPGPDVARNQSWPPVVLAVVHRRLEGSALSGRVVYLLRGLWQRECSPELPPAGAFTPPYSRGPLHLALWR